MAEIGKSQNRLPQGTQRNTEEDRIIGPWNTDTLIIEQPRNARESGGREALEIPAQCAISPLAAACNRLDSAGLAGEQRMVI
jgi:hypothetical protein